MDKKIIIKIALMVILLIAIANIDYCIYMFVDNDDKYLPNSVDYVKSDMFKFAKNYTDTFFTNLENGLYDKAYEMLHTNCKSDLFDLRLDRFTKTMQEKYFSSEKKKKYYTIENIEKENINTSDSFHAYYTVNVLSESKSLETTDSYYRPRAINIDVMKVDGTFKINMTFEEEKELEVEQNIIKE